MSHSRYNVPPELTNLLLDFTVNVLIERPIDILEYAANYFNQLREDRSTRSIISSESETEEEEEDERMIAEPPSFTRRKSVFAETYNPEDDDDDDFERVVYPKSDIQRQRLGEAVRNIFLFRALDEEQMQEVLDAMFEKKVKPGDLVIQQGDDGDNFYVIEKGLYHVFVSSGTDKGKMVGKYEDSGSFGELALMYNLPRAATVEAITEGSLWAMNRTTFRRIVVKSACNKRKEYELLLEGVPMLKSLKSYERMNLCDALMPKTFSNGELIIKQGDKADGMYFIQHGTVKITMITGEGPERGKEVEMSRLNKGQYFGELALVTHKPRAASVYAIDTVKLAFLDVHAFERLLGPCMDIMRRNIDDYERQVVDIFGCKANITDLR